MKVKKQIFKTIMLVPIWIWVIKQKLKFGLSEKHKKFYRKIFFQISYASKNVQTLSYADFIAYHLYRFQAAVFFQLVLPISNSESTIF